jgi:DNA-directed RNA polymerase subunit H (RpoH/RPB5)
MEDKISETISEMKELRKNQGFEDTYYYESKSSDVTPTTFLNSITRLNEKPVESGKKLNTIYIVNFEPDEELLNKVKIINNKLKTRFIQIFEDKTLLYNVTKHFLVPKHTRISKDKTDAATELMQRLHIKSLSKLSKILVEDPVAKFIGLNVGDLCCIERDNSVVFRLCV